MMEMVVLVARGFLINDQIPGRNQMGGRDVVRYLSSLGLNFFFAILIGYDHTSMIITTCRLSI